MRIPFSISALALAVAAWLPGGGISPALAQGSTYKIVAFSGQPAPGGGVFGSLDSPSLGADGTIGFLSCGCREDAVHGVFAGRPGALRRVVAEGDAVPGREGDTFQDFGPLSISKDGKVAFNAWIGSGETSESGIWTEGDLSAGGGGSGFDVTEWGDVAFRSGQVVAKAEIVPFASEGGIGALLRKIGGVFDAELQEGGALGDIFLQKIYDTGYYDGVGVGVDANESGEIAIKVGVRPDPSPTPFPIGAIYAGAPKNPTLVAEEEQPAPGIPDTLYYELSQHPSIAANGLLAFEATLFGDGPASAIFSGRPGAISPLVREGDGVPTTTGVTFSSMRGAVVNSTGDVVFRAQICYDGEGTREGFWIKRRTGEPVLVAIDGMKLPTPTGDREVSDVDFAGPGTFNDLHQFVFLATFDNGDRGIYVADTRPGKPFVVVRTPRKPRQFVTTEASVEVSGTAFDDTGIAKVEYTVAREVSAQKKGGKRAKKKFVVSREKRAKGDRNWSFKVPLSMGLNLISIVATDKLGNESEPYKIRMLRYDPDAK